MSGVVFAHPLTQPFHLPVSPFVAADLAAVLVLAVAFALPARAGRAPAGDEPASWAGPLSRAQVATRALAVAVLALVIAAGRLGADDELENLAPALVVGAAWPLLVIAGGAWRWLDPWDALARPFTRGERDVAAGHVWPAAVIATAWVWYLSVPRAPLAPRSVGALLAIYTLLTVAGCLAFGRVRWLSSSEPLGVLLSWTARLPRRRLLTWDPPRGAEVLLGVLIGGVLFWSTSARTAPAGSPRARWTSYAGSART
jgi:hypothetical protein